MLGNNSVCSVTSVQDTEVTFGEAIYRAVVFTLSSAVAQEGRL